MSDKYEDGSERLVTPEMLENLPLVVQRYMEATGVVGKPWIDTVYLKQTGMFRQGANRSWMQMSADETYTTNPPSFIWDARFKVGGLPLLRASDRYEAGQGHMFGKLAGLFTVFDERGEELKQASMVRYLNEMMWFPTAFLGENISWSEEAHDSVQVTFTDAGSRVSGRMIFDDDGRLINFTALRYRETGGDYSLDPWSTPITGYGEREGLLLPVRGEAVWNLPEGDLQYVDLEVHEVSYNSS